MKTCLPTNDPRAVVVHTWEEMHKVHENPMVEVALRSNYTHTPDYMQHIAGLMSMTEKPYKIRMGRYSGGDLSFTFGCEDENGHYSERNFDTKDELVDAVYQDLRVDLRVLPKSIVLHFVDAMWQEAYKRMRLDDSHSFFSQLCTHSAMHEMDANPSQWHVDSPSYVMIQNIKGPATLFASRNSLSFDMDYEKIDPEYFSVNEAIPAYQLKGKGVSLHKGHPVFHEKAFTVHRSPESNEPRVVYIIAKLIV